jgi:cytochrome o ubiquinol oxidase subunit 2
MIALSKKSKIFLISAAVIWFVGIVAWYLHTKDIAVLNPKGTIAFKERRLMLVTVALGLLVIIPVYVMTFLFAWKYREGGKKAKYSPELSGNAIAETIWWGIPTVIILTLSIITWQTSHSLDPRRQLASASQPLNIQVIALDWKWLFIYPQQEIASVNYLRIPVNTPVRFEITSDAPMNSFWIPQLGSQIYAMAGMSSQLNLMASQAGSYEGSSANLSGKGFADMRFTTDAVQQGQFDSWIESSRRMPGSLSTEEYKRLAKPSEDMAPQQFARVAPNLYQKVLLKYMAPGASDVR